MRNKYLDITSKYLTGTANYDKFPFVKVSDDSADCFVGWESIINQIQSQLSIKSELRNILCVETYQGVIDEAILPKLLNGLNPELIINTSALFRSELEIAELCSEYLGDHPIFGRMNHLQLADFMSPQELEKAQSAIENQTSGLILIYGSGATLVCNKPSLLIYADMARWEIQQRFRQNTVGNLGRKNHNDAAAVQYKQAYFIDWRVCDKHKRAWLTKSDFILDSNDNMQPKMITLDSFQKGLNLAAAQPFRVVPFFDPGVWGGQWMKEVCQLDDDEINYAWCFDCVPEENSLLFGFGEVRFEIPAIDLVFFKPVSLLGEAVYDRFGAEFPIRFDFLDTMQGGNLSLQVHPKATYMKQHFGLDYTQDESYYLLDAEKDAVVYLGLKEDVSRDSMMNDLRLAQQGQFDFPATKHVNMFPVKKHDHILIPAGTVHCSGKNSMVLEISATPYIFTFKLWDWGRVDLNGQPRTISLEHGEKNIDWTRTTKMVQEELINDISMIGEGDGWREERTGLHKTEFIETRRHWFTKKVFHDTEGHLNVLNLVQGREVLVESPLQAFEPFILHYAETFIMPAAVGAYTIRPSGNVEGEEFATLKAFVRT